MEELSVTIGCFMVILMILSNGVKAWSSINNSLAIPHSKLVLTEVFFLNPMRPLQRSWEFNTLFCLNLAINQSNDSNMRSNDISDKDAIGITGWKDVSAISKEPLVSSAVCIEENSALNVGLVGERS